MDDAGPGATDELLSLPALTRDKRNAFGGSPHRRRSRPSLVHNAPMTPAVRWVVVLCAAAAPLFALAQGLVIGGGVFDDRAALAVRTNFVPAPNVTVKLYRDGSEAAIATTRANDGGMYVFDGLT